MNVLAMSDLAICIENYILSAGEGLSKLYPAHSLWAGCIGAFQRRPDTLRDALSNAFARFRRNGAAPTDHRSPFTDHRSPVTDQDTIWALKDVSFEVKRGEVVGTLAPALLFGTPCGHNSAGTLAPARSVGERTLLKILSRITEPTEHEACLCELSGR